MHVWGCVCTVSLVFARGAIASLLSFSLHQASRVRYSLTVVLCIARNVFASCSSSFGYGTYHVQAMCAMLVHMMMCNMSAAGCVYVPRV